MEGGGLPLLNCLWQQSLRGFCSSDSSASCRWVYAVFWRILPRNYPPPRWDEGRGVLDRSNGNKRNWILVWEDGFCDFYGCEHGKSKFGPDIFFKMSHEVYNYGEGLMGKVAADNSHKWVFREISSDNDPNFFSSSSSWSGSPDAQPKAWESQFDSGIQTIAVIAVREGVVQLGSLDKAPEDLNLVISIQRKFNFLQSIPGVFAMQRPYPENHMNLWKQNFRANDVVKQEELLFSSINLQGWNSYHKTSSGFCSIPPLVLPNSCSLGMLLSRLPSVITSSNPPRAPTYPVDNNGVPRPNLFCGFDQMINVKPTVPGLQETKPRPLSLHSSLFSQKPNSVQQPEFQGQGDEQGNVLLSPGSIIH